MKKARSAATALVLSAAFLLSGVAVAPTASAAGDSVSIGKISQAKAPYGKKATVKPKVKKSGKVKVLSKTLTVKQRGKTVAKNRKSAKLKPGTYRVTTKVKYRSYKVVKTTKTVRKRVVSVPAWDETYVSCTARNVVAGYATAEFDAVCTGRDYDGTLTLVDVFVVGSDGDYTGFADDATLSFTSLPDEGATFTAWLEPADDLYQVRQIKETTSRKVWSKTKTKTRTQSLTVKAAQRRAGRRRTPGVSAQAGRPSRATVAATPGSITCREARTTRAPSPRSASARRPPPGALATGRPCASPASRTQGRITMRPERPDRPLCDVHVTVKAKSCGLPGGVSQWFSVVAVALRCAIGTRGARHE